METVQQVKEHPDTDSPSDIEQMINVLENARSEGDDAFFEALAVISKIKGMSRISQQTGLNRENLYKALKSGAKPRYNTITKVLSGLGVTIKFSPNTFPDRSN